MKYVLLEDALAALEFLEQSNSAGRKEEAKKLLTPVEFKPMAVTGFLPGCGEGWTTAVFSSKDVADGESVYVKREAK